MKPVVFKVLRITAGIALLIIGAIGGLIPIFQGWVFGLAGLALLSKDIPFIRRWYDWARARFREIQTKKQGPKSASGSAANRSSPRSSAHRSNEE